jgi:hypothetical protein
MRVEASMQHGVSWDGTFSVGDALTAASVLAAALTFFVRSWFLQRQERRQTTFLLLSRIFEPGPVAEARIKMARWIAEDRTIDDDLIENESDDRVILALVDFYEFVCEGAMRGVVDRRLLNQESGGRMERAFAVARRYIRKRQDRLTEINRRNGMGAVVLYRHLRAFLSKQRGVDTSV